MDYEVFSEFLADMDINSSIIEESDKTYICIETPYITALNEWYTFVFDKQGKMIDVKRGEEE